MHKLRAVTKMNNRRIPFFFLIAVRNVYIYNIVV